MNCIIIASPFRADLTAVENAHNSIIASQKLVDLVAAPLQTAVGSWKEEGQEEAATELSFIMPVPVGKMSLVTDIFFNEYQQDAVLMVSPNTFKAALLTRENKVIELGTFQVITEEEAKASECYTYWQGKYWLAK
ncbi:SAM-dependent methyltransferase [Vibrio phage D530]